jgi:hypothetical protein
MLERRVLLNSATTFLILLLHHWTLLYLPSTSLSPSFFPALCSLRASRQILGYHWGHCILL